MQPSETGMQPGIGRRKKTANAPLEQRCRRNGHALWQVGQNHGRVKGALAAGEPGRAVPGNLAEEAHG